MSLEEKGIRTTGDRNADDDVSLLGLGPSDGSDARPEDGRDDLQLGGHTLIL